MASSSAKDKDSAKYFDVSKPGKTPPNASSRPAIVGHRTIVKDPMLNLPIEVSDGEPKAEAAHTTLTKIKLIPPSEIAKQADAKAAKAADETVEPAPEKAKDDPVPAPEPVTEDKKEAGPEPDAENKSKIVVTDTIEEEKPGIQDEKKTDSPDMSGSDGNEDDPKVTPDVQAENQKLADKRLKEEIAKKEAIEKLVADKTYYAPIGEKKHRRSRRHAITTVLVILLLLAALGDLMIDSGTIKTSIKPPISFFNTK